MLGCLNWKCFYGNKVSRFSLSCFRTCVFKEILFPAILPLILVYWNNLNQLLLKKSIVSQPTMGEKFEILNFVASRLLHRSPENISARYFERGVVDIVYFYVNFLFLTKALSCPCRHFLKNTFTLIPTLWKDLPTHLKILVFQLILVSWWYNYANKINCNLVKKPANSL